MMSYTLHRARRRPNLLGEPDGEGWGEAEVVQLTNFYALPGVSDHRPRTEARALYDDEHFYLQFCVEDRWVRSVQDEPQAMVCQDSCVEFFFSPRPGDRYLNLEMNAGGWALFQDGEFQGDREGFTCQPVAASLMESLMIESTLPPRVEPELTEPTTWRLGVAIPWAALRAQVADLPVGPGVTWRGNFYKCGDLTSHPHWASWSPVRIEPTSFHHPPSFGELRFA